MSLGIDHRRGPSTSLLLRRSRQVAASRVRDLGVTLTVFYFVVIVVAGASAGALLGWPAHSGSFFSWDLGAPTVAATIGGLYLASVITFVVALVSPRSQTRSLNWGVLALAIPTLWFTITHHNVFDWSRPQAVAWVGLFASAPTSIALDLREPVGTDSSRPSSHATRATLAVMAIASAMAAFALWLEPVRTAVAPHSPIPLIGLTGRYLGAWCAFLATSAGVAAIRGRRSDARLVAVLFGSVSAATLLAAARTIGDLGPNAAVYAAAVASLGGLAGMLHRANEPASRRAHDEAGTTRSRSKSCCQPARTTTERTRK